MSTKEDFSDDYNFTTGGNIALHPAPLAQWFQNYYAPDYSATSGGFPMAYPTNHFNVNLVPRSNSNDTFHGNLNNPPAFHNFNHYTALGVAQSPQPYLGHANDMLAPFGQMSHNQYYATSGMLPQPVPRFTQPQQRVIPSTENWEVAPTTPVTTVRLETISPDVLRGRYTRPVESSYQMSGYTPSYDSSYRHFELDEHEHELSVPPPQLHDGSVRSQLSQTPAPSDKAAANTEGCFAVEQCGNRNDEDLIGCRNGSCVVAFHPECVKLGAREDGLPACPSCFSVVDTALGGQLNDVASSYAPPTQSPSASASASASARSTLSPPRATPALSVGSSFHPSPSPTAPKRRRATTPQHRAIKIESSSPPAAPELFGSYRGSIVVPEGFESARGLNNKGAWTADEDAACIRVMRNLLDIHKDNRRIAIDKLWERASEDLAKKEGVDRSSSGVKMQWTRRLRAQSGVDERAVKRPDLMCTGLLKRGIPRRSRVVERTPPSTPTTRRSTKLRGSAAQTSHLTATHVKNSRIVKLKIGAGVANVATTTGKRRGRGGPHRARAKSQKKIEQFEDDVSPIIEEPDEAISMYGRGVTPVLGMQQEMDIDVEGYNGSPTSSFEEALEDTLMDRGYVMEE